jgi:membrane-bound lytic murein transglycosylase D
MLRNGIWLSVILIFLFAGCSVRPFDMSRFVTPQEQTPAALNPDHMGSDLATKSGQDDYSVVPEFRENSVLGTEPMKNQDKLIAKTGTDHEAHKLLRHVPGDGHALSQQSDSIIEEELVYDLPMTENALVKRFIDYYSGDGKKTFSIWMERSSRYLPMMQEIFASEGLPRDLTYLAMVESGFNDKAYSWAHAVGPWQFIESTGERYGLQNDWWRDERRDPVKATIAAARYLKDLHGQFNGNWYLAIAAYNAGPGKIRRAVKKYNSEDFWALTHGSYLRRETKEYIPKLLAVIKLAKQPERYGFNDLAYQEPFSFETTILPTSTDLAVVASLSGVEYDEIKKLNPELKRWCSPPDALDYELRLPIGTLDDFEKKYATLPQSKRANYVRHTITSGDTLLALSNRYGVRVKDIERLNQIHNPRALQLGRNLLIPLNPDFDARAVKELKDDYKRSRRQFYTVREGDSLWSISRKFNVSQKQLRVWNMLGWSNHISPGQRLVVSSHAATVRKANTPPSQNGSLLKMVYRVQPGDTLWGIGRQFAVETHQIRDWNNLSNNHILQPGESLTLMVRDQSSG